MSQAGTMFSVSLFSVPVGAGGGLSGILPPTMYDGHFTSRVAARKKTKNQTRSTQTSHYGEDGSKAATTEDKA